MDEVTHNEIEYVLSALALVSLVFALAINSTLGKFYYGFVVFVTPILSRLIFYFFGKIACSNSYRILYILSTMAYGVGLGYVYNEAPIGGYDQQELLLAVFVVKIVFDIVLTAAFYGGSRDS